MLFTRPYIRARDCTDQNDILSQSGDSALDLFGGISLDASHLLTQFLVSENTRVSSHERGPL